MRFLIAALLLLLALPVRAEITLGLTAPAWAGWNEGLAAYERGDYATALREWRPLAEHRQGVFNRMPSSSTSPTRNRRPTR